jgi:hypothetical protein
MLKLISAFGALAALATPAAAEEAKVGRDTRPAVKQGDKIVCKRIQDIQWRTASYQVCFKASKWRQISRDLQLEIDDYGRSGSFGTFGG